MRQTGKHVLVVAILLIFAATGLFAGVRQLRVANNTNLGTNAGNTNVQNTQGGYNYNNTYQAAVTYAGYGTVAAGDYYNDYGGWSATAPAGSQIPIGTVIQYLPSSAIPIMVERDRYYYDSNVFFSEVFDGGAVVYQVVPAPLGAVVSVLPSNCFARTWNGKSVTVCGNTAYMQVAGGYQVVAAQ